MEFLKEANDYLDAIESNSAARWQTANMGTLMNPRFHKAMTIILKKRQPLMYMATFTLKPTDTHTREENEAFLRKQAERTTWGKIYKCHLVHELTKAGKDHWHMAFSTEKPMKNHDFKGWTPRGHMKINKNRSNCYETIITYMSKSNTPEVLKGV